MLLSHPNLGQTVSEIVMVIINHCFLETTLVSQIHGSSNRGWGWGGMLFNVKKQFDPD